MVIIPLVDRGLPGQHLQNLTIPNNTDFPKQKKRKRMTEPKGRLSPIKKVKAAFVRSPTSPTLPTSETIKFDEKAVTEPNSRMEDIYFDDPRSRESLSINPGDHPKHESERKLCTSENWKAEIERRILAESRMVDHAYDNKHPFRSQAYGHGDGQK